MKEPEHHTNMKSEVYEDWYRMEMPASANGAESSRTRAPALSGDENMSDDALAHGELLTHQDDHHESRVGGRSMCHTRLRRGRVCY